MVNEDSPIKNFYPVEFQTDLNGKEQEWEALVLIPFIDEDKLKTAMDMCSSHLHKEVRLQLEHRSSFRSSFSKRSDFSWVVG